MKKVIALIFALCLMVFVPGISLAADNIGFHAVKAYLENDTLTVNGWFYNVGDSIITNLSDVTLKVTDKNGIPVALSTLNDSNLYSLTLKPGAVQKWTFRIQGSETNVDLSQFTCQYGFNYKVMGRQDLGKGIKVFINGKPIEFPSAKPLIQEGRSLVPMRVIFEKLGAEVKWDQKTKTITAKKGDRTILLTINKKQAYVNNKPLNLDVPAKLINNSTYVPLRFVTESLGANIFWGAQDQIISICQ